MTQVQITDLAAEIRRAIDMRYTAWLRNTAEASDDYTDGMLDAAVEVATEREKAKNDEIRALKENLVVERDGWKDIVDAVRAELGEARRDLLRLYRALGLVAETDIDDAVAEATAIYDERHQLRAQLAELRPAGESGDAGARQAVADERSSIEWGVRDTDEPDLTLPCPEGEAQARKRAKQYRTQVKTRRIGPWQDVSPSDLPVAPNLGEDGWRAAMQAMVDWAQWHHDRADHHGDEEAADAYAWAATAALCGVRNPERAKRDVFARYREPYSPPATPAFGGSVKVTPAPKEPQTCADCGSGPEDIGCGPGCPRPAPAKEPGETR